MNTGVVTCPRCGKKNRVPAAASGRPRCARCHAWLPWVVDASDADFDAVADAATIPVLVDLWAPWCGPCRMVSPALERLAQELAGQFKLVKVNIDASPRLAQRFGAQSIPMLLLLEDGRVIAEQIGAAPEGTLRAWLQQHVSRLTPNESATS
jgi:thioredoxin 2